MNTKRGRSMADVVSSLEDDPVERASSEIVPPAAERLVPPAIVPINILVTPQDRKRLRQLSLDTGMSLQKLGHEAWNQLLKARGLDPLEPVSANIPSGRLRRNRLS